MNFVVTELCLEGSRRYGCLDVWRCVTVVVTELYSYGGLAARCGCSDLCEDSRPRVNAKDLDYYLQEVIT